jgi:outer membrane protein OmpA-like peptidoglycan-associated protein
MKKLIMLLMCVSLILTVGCAGSMFSNTPYKKVMAEEMTISIAEPAAKEVAIPAAVQIVRIKEKIMFDFDKAVIRDDQKETISKVAELLNEFPETAIALDGYASKEGPVDYNQALSLSRAQAVKDALVAEGVAADKINVLGHGATSDFGDILKSNRRVMVLSIN